MEQEQRQRRRRSTCVTVETESFGPEVVLFASGHIFSRYCMFKYSMAPRVVTSHGPEVVLVSGYTTTKHFRHAERVLSTTVMYVGPRR